VDLVLLCSGKVGHVLHAERERRGAHRTAIVRWEQLFPVVPEAIRATADRFPRARLRWVQEEPANQGRPGRSCVAGCRELLPDRDVALVSRPAAAAPATGSGRRHGRRRRPCSTRPSPRWRPPRTGPGRRPEGRVSPPHRRGDAPGGCRGWDRGPAAAAGAVPDRVRHRCSPVPRHRSESPFHSHRTHRAESPRVPAAPGSRVLVVPVGPSRLPGTLGWRKGGAL
jgi:hypothetical protein